MTKEKKIGKRITWSEDDKGTFFLIPGQVEGWKETLLLTWVIAWMICGVAVCLQIFGEYSKETKMSLVIYMAFWAYFAYKGINAWLWRKFGTEMIRVDSEGIKVKRDIKGYGRVRTYFIDNIRKIEPLQRKAGSFAHTFNRSFWVIGGETILLDYLGQDVALGMQLSENEREQLIKHLRRLTKDQGKKVSGSRS